MKKNLSSTNKIRLRYGPIGTSEYNARKFFKLNEIWEPLTYIKNEYEDQIDTVVDYTTGLMWEKIGSQCEMRLKKTEFYINDLNYNNFAGYSDWRLPTVEELLSLLEPEVQVNGLFIDPILFDSWHGYSWSSDHALLLNGAWIVNFMTDCQRVYWLSIFGRAGVRAVRSLTDQKGL